MGEGERSKADCGYGYSGSAYRMCENGELGEIHMDKYVYEKPRNIHYGKSEFEMVMGIEWSIEKPKYENNVTKWRMVEEWSCRWDWYCMS